NSAFLAAAISRSQRSRSSANFAGGSTNLTVLQIKVCMIFDPPNLSYALAFTRLRRPIQSPMLFPPGGVCPVPSRRPSKNRRVGPLGSEPVEDVDQKRRSRQRSEERPYLAGPEIAAEDDNQHYEQTKNQSRVFQPFRIHAFAPIRLSLRVSVGD